MFLGSSYPRSSQADVLCVDYARPTVSFYMTIGATVRKSIPDGKFMVQVVFQLLFIDNFLSDWNQYLFILRFPIFIDREHLYIFSVGSTVCSPQRHLSILILTHDGGWRKPALKSLFRNKIRSIHFMVIDCHNQIFVSDGN